MVVRDKLNTSQIVEAFRDNMDIVNGYIRELSLIENEYQNKYDENIAKYGSHALLVNKIFLSEYQKPLNRLKKYRQLKQLMRHDNYEGQITQKEIIRAKEVPIRELYDFQRVKEKREGFTAICPFHQEANSSFSVRNNYFICFVGCGKGDSISFLMKLKSIKFIDAVKDLCAWKN